MLTAKIFENGRSQAVRLPKEYRFDETEVRVHKIGEVVMIMPKKKAAEWSGLLNSLELFSDDFMSDGRSEETLSERESF